MSKNPKVSILLATYNPHKPWLKELLKSLNNQDYDNYNVIILDDFSSNITFDELSSIVKENITKVKYELKQSKENSGSNVTFESLVKLSDSKYVLFADQDDIWHQDKLSKSIELLLSSNKKMMYGDVDIIDENGTLKSPSITTYRKRFKFYDDDIFKHLIYKNFVMGCTLCIEREFVLSSLPFPASMYYDQYLGLFASYHDEMVMFKGPLLDYRVHKNNQTNSLAKVVDKESYYQENILRFAKRVEELSLRFNNPELDIAKKWSEARIGNYNHDENARNELKKLSDVNPNVTKFELYALHNKVLFKVALKLIQSNKI